MTTATFIRASLVRCATPLHPPDAPASLELRVVRGGSHVAGGLASGPLPFSFYDADATPYTAAATPPHASVHGGSQVLVTGGGFRPAGAALQCRVGGVAVPAVFVSISSASCVMPPYAPRWGEDVTVEVCISPISPLHLRHISAISPPGVHLRRRRRKLRRVRRHGDLLRP